MQALFVVFGEVRIKIMLIHCDLHKLTDGMRDYGRVGLATLEVIHLYNRL